ncbi:MAG: PHP domain-containing protein [Erysipelotrichaceae bacterium]
MIDLHIHSNASFDASESIDTIVSMAKQQKITTIAICDHNEVVGSLAAQQADIDVISGIEIDCRYHDHILHILGYGCDLTRDVFQTWKQTYQTELKRIQAVRIAQINAHFGLTIQASEVIAYCGNEAFTNVELEQYMFACVSHPDFIPYISGDKKDNPIANFYWDYMDVGKPCYCELNLVDFNTVKQWIIEAGGVVIVAHPKMNLKNDPALVSQLIDEGIDGFEVYCSYHNREDQAFYLSYCQQHDLLQTCGSDFHGVTKPNIALGQHDFQGDHELMVARLKARIASRTYE